jgi:hypothetical protein
LARNELIFKIEHLVNSGLMFIYLIAAGGHSASEFYGVFATSLAYFYLYMLMINSTVLEPMQILIAKNKNRILLSTSLRVARQQSRLTWYCTLILTIVVLMLVFKSEQKTILYVISVLIAGFFSAQVQIARRVVVVVDKPHYSILFVSLNFFTLIVSICLFKFKFLDVINSFILWQIIIGTLCFLWMKYSYSDLCSSNARIKTIRNYFYSYAKNNLFLSPFAWFFGNVIYIVGPTIVGLEEIAEFRKVTNLTSPLLQIYSISGVLFLSRCAAMPNLRAAIMQIRGSIYVNTLTVAAYGTSLFLLIHLVSFYFDVSKYIPSTNVGWTFVVWMLMYSYIESFNYLIGSALRVNNFKAPLYFMSILPSVLLGLYMVTMHPSDLLSILIVASSISVAVLLTTVGLAWRYVR